ncbi:ARABIDOPSIS THALIANA PHOSPHOLIPASE D DELTA, phospholipase D delta [Hibiscus trionum]|uniref:Phospholipase D n=1 Tax=Hibiscus trionum TaxID=183268 RepID=A0A9W7M5I4_HIBTR|nr:ARABIDOPSIS THALIANA PHOSPHOLIPASE D DELTA, phospholipase D delta [Hibiscus trionum]
MSEDNLPEPVLCLHGDLELKIIEARCLPNMDLLSDRLRRCFTPFDPFTKKKKNHRSRKIITSDPYVTVCLAGATVARTRVISNAQDPIWSERFRIPLAHPANQFEFFIKDNDVFGADLIGVATVQAADVLAGEMIRGWFPLITTYGKPPKPDCALHLEMKFTKCEEMPLFKFGNAANPNGFGFGNCYFPARHGGSITLYQDAHVMNPMLPEIELENGTVFKNEPCWEDICHAILEAHHLVYITGWSVFHEVKLVREPSKPLPKGGDLNLGDLLKFKSEEGVRVLVLVWDDKTSHSKFFINTAGVMQTHDEETRKFFRHTPVTCVLSPRYASSKLSIFKQQVVGTLFTHHQKCVIVDSLASGNNRKITAFLGGLDLCDGRYDTPEHRLFRDLDTVYRGDFHNPTYSAGIRCPREPWHDLHCKVEGPAAYDVLKNFEQRWRKATKWAELGRRFKRGSKSEESLLKLDRISWILSPSQTIPQDDPSLWVCSVGDSENWNVQVFRSIDSGSVKGFPKDIYKADLENLVCAKNLVIDKSIQTAYIQAIRAAQHFIYIENQYFIGSSYAWPSYRAGADNLIPMELALKIASKIRAKERFAVYVVMPMWPEGVPTSTSVQEILFWQGQTLKMMYGLIGKELKSMSMEDSHPQDYLNFYCLGQREELPSDYSWSRSCLLSPTGDAISSSLRFQRFMIYVHAKGMIVDDEYVILGSANINQRSMAGSRDTEIAIGACQPHYTWKERKRHPWGQVYGYRMSLWAEHMHMVDDLFKEPGSLECVKTVNDIAEENWKRYSSNEFKHLQGHLLKYPISVTRSGKVGTLPGQETFPDVGGKILGCRSTLPHALTT